MDALLTAIMLWLAANFSLPASYELPQVRRVPPSTILAMRYKGVLGETLGAQLTPFQVQDVVSVYDDDARAIYLQDNWTGRTPTELSILVHEMVHHLQKINNEKFECPQQREQLAYAAQQRWLNLFNRDLAQDFEIDPFTLLVKTSCGY